MQCSGAQEEDGREKGQGVERGWKIKGERGKGKKGVAGGRKMADKEDRGRDGRECQWVKKVKINPWSAYDYIVVVASVYSSNDNMALSVVNKGMTLVIKDGKIIREAHWARSTKNID